jgi:hypothetical protein
MSPTAKTGQKATATAEASYQSRNDAGWAFHFSLVCA